MCNKKHLNLFSRGDTVPATARTEGSPNPTRTSMLITAIETSVVSLPFSMGGPHPLFAGQPWDELEILVVKVETDDNLVGWGEAFGHAAIPATKAALDTIVAPL